MTLSEAAGFAPRRFHPATLFFGLGMFLRRAALPMIVALLQAPSAADVILPGLLVLAFAGQILSWWRRSYAVEGGVLHLHEGVVSRRHRAVPLDRIQQVDVHRTLRHRVLGVATLRVETAGDASGTEVHLNVVALEEAAQLRALLLAARRLRDTAPDDDTPRLEPLVALTPGEVALAGITGPHLGVMFTVLFWPLQLLDDIPGDQFDDFNPASLSATDTQLVAAALLFLPIWLGLAAAASLLRDFGFTMERDGDEIVVRRGLLETREAHIALARVQVVRITQSSLRRPLGMAAVRVQSAGASGEANRVVVPILPATSVEPLLAALLDTPVLLAPLRAAPGAAARRRRIRGTALGAAIAVPFLLAARAAPVWLAALPPLVLAGWALGGAWYRGLGHAVRDGVVVSRQGAVSRRIVVVPISKVQSARVRSSPMQRLVGLATTHLDVAARGSVPTVVDEDPVHARRIAADAARPTNLRQ